MTDALREAVAAWRERYGDAKLVAGTAGPSNLVRWDGMDIVGAGVVRDPLARALIDAACRTALQEPAPVVQPDMPKSLYWRNPAANAAAPMVPTDCHTFTLQAGAAPSQLVEDARAKAIEECAKVCDDYPKRDPAEDGSGYWAAAECAAAIRSMGAK